MAISRSSPSGSGGGADTGLFVLLFDSKKNHGSKNQETQEALLFNTLDILEMI